MNFNAVCCSKNVTTPLTQSKTVLMTTFTDDPSSHSTLVYLSNDIIFDHFISQLYPRNI